jgi:hypothetical protein
MFVPFIGDDVILVNELPDDDFMESGKPLEAVELEFRGIARRHSGFVLRRNSVAVSQAVAVLDEQQESDAILLKRGNKVKTEPDQHRRAVFR